MECWSCHASFPYMPDNAESPCLFCGNPIKFSEEEYLTYPELGLIKEKRDNQIQLATEIKKTIAPVNTNNKSAFVAEAGTGIGKSYAYLLPSILRRKQVLISTAKKTLQNQLVEKDIPYLATKLKHPVKYEVAYGKSNYACEARVRALKNSRRKKEIINFLGKSKDGLWSEDPSIRGSKDLSAEFCKGSKCSLYNQCKYIQAKKRISEADIVVANHWLFGFILRLQEEGVGVGVNYDAVIIDEAHKLEEGIRNAFSSELKESALNNIINEYYSLDPLLNFPEEDNLKLAWEDLFSGNTQDVKFHKLGNTLNKSLAAIGKKEFVRKTLGMNPSTVVIGTADAARLDALRVLVEQLNQINKFLTEKNDANRVVYAENNIGDTVIKSSPIEVASILKAAIDVPAVYLSATLKVNNTLDNFMRKTGLNPATTPSGDYPSPFDYRKQAALYLTKTVPSPSRHDDKVENYRYKLAEEIKDLVEANNGNAFVLFTAKDEMTSVYMHLREHCSLPVFVQNTNNKELIDNYNKTDNAVLLGLKSFWEGVDIPGEKLSLVIITKLPFPSVSDPINKAKKEAAGDKAFMSVDLPEMILDLRQGVGRLIRTANDQGTVAILDSRLLTKRYTQIVLKSLGLPRVTSNKTAILKHLQKQNECT